MSTPQDPMVRKKQKARRTKQLAAWREKNAKAPATEKPATEKKSDKSAKKPAKKG